MKKWLFLNILLIIILGNALPAQGLQSPRDWPASLRQAPKLSVGMDTRRSFISRSDVKIIGLKVNLDFENRLRLGYGVYFLGSPFFRNFIVPTQLGNLDTINSRLDFVYLSAFAEYVFFLNERWEFSSPISLGIGDVGFQNIGEEKKTVLLTELSVMGSYKIFPFFGLGGGIGYRQILAGGQVVRENFNSPIYSFGLRFWIGYLYQKYIKKSISTIPYNSQTKIYGYNY